MNGYMALDIRLYGVGHTVKNERGDGMNGYMTLDTRLRTREAME